jgi:hypothetical protein
MAFVYTTYALDINVHPVPVVGDVMEVLLRVPDRGQNPGPPGGPCLVCSNYASRSNYGFEPTWLGVGFLGEWSVIQLGYLITTSGQYGVLPICCLICGTTGQV